jgi:hypothetical protein
MLLAVGVIHFMARTIFTGRYFLALFLYNSVGVRLRGRVYYRRRRPASFSDRPLTRTFFCDALPFRAND